MIGTLKKFDNCRITFRKYYKFYSFNNTKDVEGDLIKRKYVFATIGIVALLLFLELPMIDAQAIQTNWASPERDPTTTSLSQERGDSSNPVKLRVLLCKTDGSIEDSIVELTRKQKNDLFDQLGELETCQLSVKEFFEEKIRLLKQYDIVSDQITMSSLLSENQPKDDPLINITIVQNENFSAVSAPIFFTGVGFGVGIGFRRMPIIRRFAGNIGFVGLLVVGGLLCYNWLERTLHINYGFIYPMYFGFLSGFIGIMMFAVDSLFPPPGGPPITLYSNFLALGWTGYTSWIDLTSIIP
jgi:hypothetical protein